MSVRLELLAPVLLALGAPAPAPAPATSDADVVEPPEVRAEDEALAAALEPGARACGVWRAALGRGRTAVLAASCVGPEPGLAPAPSRWTLSVVRASDPARRLARAVLSSRDEPLAGCGARGLLRVRGDVLGGEPVLEVGWGCRSEGDGMFPALELWRLGPKGLRRIFRMPSSTGTAPDGTAYGVSWRPAPAQGGAPSLEVSWAYHSSAGGEPAWSGAQRLPYRFDGAAFRPPAGALVLASAYASAWLPPSSVAEYAPPLAFDGRAETAWCTRAAQRPWLSIQLAAPTRLRALRILPGYGKSEASFLDNARVARVLVDVGDGLRSASFPAELADARRPQEVPIRMFTGEIAWIRVTALEVRPGRRSQDVCLSELQVVPEAAAVR